MVEAQETKTFVEKALENAEGALTGIQKAKELFFGGESPGFFQKFKGFFGFTLAQLENNPHFNSPSDLAQKKQIEKLFHKMENVTEENQGRFLQENFFGPE